MPESSTQPNKDYPEKSVVTIEVDGEQQAKNVSDTSQVLPSSPVIWTPRFIVLFFLTLVIGLSIESLLTQGMLNGFYRAEWVLLGHTGLILACLLALIARARSMWMRIGGMFGCLWTLFTGASFLVNPLSIDTRASIIAQLSAAASSALLGSYICFSTNRIPLRRWDSWFFRLAPLLGACAIVATDVLLPIRNHPIRSFENATTLVVFFLCIAIWWIRPSCWKSQPCSTFLFGIVPALSLILFYLNTGDLQARFFFSQVTLLCALLGVLRVLQGEIQQRSHRIASSGDFRAYKG